MAMYKARGDSHNIIYSYITPEGKRQQQWETYTSELEALHRKAYIDYLQKTKSQDGLTKAAIDYKEKRAAEKAAQEALLNMTPIIVENESVPASEDNTKKTYREFIDKWLPYHTRKNRLSPNTYDSYIGNLNRHILPYFGDKIMSTIKSEDVDDFIDHLSRKQCQGSKSYHRSPNNVPTLFSSSVKKCYNILTAGFHVAKKWRYITEIPETTAPAEKWKKT